LKSVRITPRADRDLTRLEDFLTGKSERAARGAVRAIRDQLGSLSELSDRGRPGPRSGLRELKIAFGRDGYVAQYRTTDNEVSILRVFHARERR
jgi:plasmid stabilization system protein ParE